MYPSLNATNRTNKTIITTILLLYKRYPSKKILIKKYKILKSGKNGHVAKAIIKENGLFSGQP